MTTALVLLNGELLPWGPDDMQEYLEQYGVVTHERSGRNGMWLTYEKIPDEEDAQTRYYRVWVLGDTDRTDGRWMCKFGLEGSSVSAQEDLDLVKEVEKYRRHHAKRLALHECLRGNDNV